MLTHAEEIARGYRTKSGHLTGKALALGYIERFGPHVTLSREHGTLIVRRSPHHPDGHACDGFRNLSDARRCARVNRVG